MLKHFTPLLLAFAAADASAETYDPCISAGAQIKAIAVARDNHEPLSKFLKSKADKFSDPAEEERYYRATAMVYMNPSLTADNLETYVIDECVKAANQPKL